MNGHRIWLLWRHGRNTAEIARRLKMEEHKVYETIRKGQDARYMGRPMPWSKTA